MCAALDISKRTYYKYRNSEDKDYYDYLLIKEILYESGLDERIEILGATDILEKDRESEIIDYLEKHQNINKFIILDDGNFFELKKYQVQTVFEKGFDNKKYQEAVELINSINWR